LTRNGGATAYSFTAPTSTDAAIPALTYTVCGHKTDALENSIPC
jgi:hypothetical protein